MNKNKLLLWSFFHALGAALYIFFVATLMQNAERIFGDTPDNKLLAPVVFLMLFVFSASVEGALILGRPILLYWDNKKSEALKFFGYTLLWFFGLFIIAVLALIKFTLYK